MTGAEISAIDLLEYGVVGTTITLAALSKMEGELDSSDSYMGHYHDEIELLAEGENGYPVNKRLEHTESMIENGIGDPSDRVLAQREAQKDYLEIQNEKFDEYKNLV